VPLWSGWGALGAMFKVHAQVQTPNAKVSAMTECLTQVPLLLAGLVQALVGKGWQALVVRFHLAPRFRQLLVSGSHRWRP
jgi:hypothetical protein